MFQWDEFLFRLVNSGCSNRIFDAVMPVVTLAGSFEYLVIASLFFFLSKRKDMQMCALLLLLALFTAHLLIDPLKEWFVRPRPFRVLADVRQLVGAYGFSFPSGHTVLVFTFASVLGACFRKARMIYLLAVLVAFSRVYLGVHFPLDVLAGALTGTFIGLGIFTFYKIMLKFRKEDPRRNA